MFSPELLLVGDRVVVIGREAGAARGRIAPGTTLQVVDIADPSSPDGGARGVVRLLAGHRAPARRRGPARRVGRSAGPRVRRARVVPSRDDRAGAQPGRRPRVQHRRLAAARDDGRGRRRGPRTARRLRGRGDPRRRRRPGHGRRRGLRRRRPGGHRDDRRHDPERDGLHVGRPPLPRQLGLPDGLGGLLLGRAADERRSRRRSGLLRRGLDLPLRLRPRRHRDDVRRVGPGRGRDREPVVDGRARRRAAGGGRGRRRRPATSTRS